MVKSYTARYTKTDSGYMGQLVEWPEVVSEGKDVEECRFMLRDALREMALAYEEQGKALPASGGLLEQLSIEVDVVSQTAWSGQIFQRQRLSTSARRCESCYD